MSDQWGPADLALPDDEKMATDANGTLVIPFEVQRLLVFLYKHWKMPPEFRGHTVNCYLTEVYRQIYYTPKWIVPLVVEKLVEELKQSWRYKPLPSYIQELCGAACRMTRAWQDIGFAHTYSPVEPSRLPLSDSDRLRKAALNNALKSRSNNNSNRPYRNRPRHKPRVMLEDDD